MAFTVVYDANVLYPAPLRDLLLQLALAGEFRARYTSEILDEVFLNLAERRSDIDPTQLASAAGNRRARRACHRAHAAR
jgi:hypothetical protein